MWELVVKQRKFVRRESEAEKPGIRESVYRRIPDCLATLGLEDLRVEKHSTEMGSRIELGDVTPHNIKQLKRLNQVIFPVSYNDKFYKDVLEVGELAKLAYFNDIAVGAVCCRVDHSQNQKRLYIMTLGCLAPYRRLGIGTKMLNHVLNICEKDGTFDNIYLHVQISNESAIDFYRKFGFEIIETKKNYYKRIEPADAHVLQKNLKAPCLGQNADVQKTDN
ncbi:N-alpha-acetyltransferase 50 [Cyanistes caeruleus]|uniref:N-alpha-acetyltransferase 50 n=1 Tax=Cyanistes caeruleus TaxID=156563 RepID=A0A8C0V4Q8_CYACU|nr:N-alpha-acetyltransferase 50 [Cyanistes caeruleus]